MAVASRLDKVAGSSGNGGVTGAASVMHATNLAAFNEAAEQSGKPWRLSPLEPRGWQVVHATKNDPLLEMPDARSDFEAVKLAVGFLRSWGHL